MLCETEASILFITEKYQKVLRGGRLVGFAHQKNVLIGLKQFLPSDSLLDALIFGWNTGKGVMEPLMASSAQDDAEIQESRGEARLE